LEKVGTARFQLIGTECNESVLRFEAIGLHFTSSDNIYMRECGQQTLGVTASHQATTRLQTATRCVLILPLQ